MSTPRTYPINGQPTARPPRTLLFVFAIPLAATACAEPPGAGPDEAEIVGTTQSLAVPVDEAWRHDITLGHETVTQAVASDGVGNSYVAGVVRAADFSYSRFIQKLDSSGVEVWRFESAPTTAYADIAHQQLHVDEGGGALYVLRSNVQSVGVHVASVAKHDLNDGTVLWNGLGGVSRVPLGTPRSSAFGVSSSGSVWVALQSETSFVGDGLRWTIAYRKLDTATGATQGTGILSAKSGLDRYLIDLSVNEDRLFVAYREEALSSADLVITGYDVASGSLSIVNPHEPTPCSTTAPCRQAFQPSIPDSTTGTATFTDAAFDAQGNFVVAGYYEVFEPDDCRPECFDDLYSYLPVIVKVDHNNRVLFEAIEPSDSPVRFVVSRTPSSGMRAWVAAGEGASVFVLLSGERPSAQLARLDGSGSVMSHRVLDPYVTETFSSSSCPQWSPLWHPGALTGAPGGRVVVTGKMPVHCAYGRLLTDLDTSRTVSFRHPTDGIVWQHDDGQVHYWPMSEGRRLGGVDVRGPVSSDWALRGVGDVDGDGADDIVWQHTSGQVRYWNGQLTDIAYVHTPVGPDWALRGVGDVDGDGTDDIVWRHSSGQVHYWPMQDGRRTGGVDIERPVSTDWSLRGVGDVDGDGTDDLVWQHTGGQVHYWSMRDGRRTGGHHIHTPAPSDWSLRGIGDVDGDGTDDLVWRLSSGQVHYWSMNGGVRTGGHDVHTPVGSRWTIRAAGKLMTDPPRCDDRERNGGETGRDCGGPFCNECLWGAADLHAHPATHLGFGALSNGTEGLFWGRPGGSHLTSNVLADLPACATDKHSGFTTDLVNHRSRINVLSEFDAVTGHPHGSNGAPTFASWPHARSISHQQMHVMWIRRAWEGGLRLMVASVTDNQLIETLWHRHWGARPPVVSDSFDYFSAIEQIRFIQQLVEANSDWMEIVVTASDAREAVASGKLAIVLALEMDRLSPAQIRTLARDHGVRVVTPIHLVDNEFGGAAVYEDAFNTANYYFNGSFFSVQDDPALAFRFSSFQKVLRYVVSGPEAGALKPEESFAYDACCGGHRNTLGLTEAPFLELLRAGLMIDVAHMSEEATEDALDLADAYDYPLFNTHTGVRPATGTADSERSLRRDHARRLAASGGLIGLGTDVPAPRPIATWVGYLADVRQLVGDYAVAIGTDMNGFAPQIADPESTITYPIPVRDGSGGSLPQLVAGSKIYDFNVDGLAHYGMLPDFFEAVHQEGGLEATDAIFSSAEAFIQMWEDVEQTQVP